MDNFCDRCRIELSAYLDGELEKEFHQEVQAHLGNCEPCSDELTTLKSLTTLLTENILGPEASMPDIWAGIEGSLPSVCDVMREDLSAYLDSELTPPAQEGVNKHLKECNDCLSDFKALNAANQFLVKGLELPASIKVDLWPAVKARLNEDCALIKSELSSYVDQEVPTLRHRGITTHLMECQDCRLEFNQISSVGDIIRDVYKPELPENFDLWPEIRSKLQVVPFSPKTAEPAAAASNKPAKFSGRKNVYLTAAAAVTIAIAGSLTFFVISPQPAPAETVSSENYLIESALMEPTDNAEAVVYEQN
jgi:predicted anti-sigma-YlaC factor YlaD